MGINFILIYCWRGTLPKRPIRILRSLLEHIPWYTWRGSWIQWPWVWTPPPGWQSRAVSDWQRKAGRRWGRRWGRSRHPPGSYTGPSPPTWLSCPEQSSTESPRPVLCRRTCNTNLSIQRELRVSPIKGSPFCSNVTHPTATRSQIHVSGK